MLSRLYAAMYDKVSEGSEKAGMRERRRSLLADAQGATIEIGAGTGQNVQHYPASVIRLVLVEPDRHMARRLGRRVHAHRPDAEIVNAEAGRLPFADASFDTAVVTFVLCSVADQQAALAEMNRVLKPGGRLLFLEHVRSDDEKIAARQRRYRRCYGLIGCDPTRATLESIEASPFAVESVEHGEVPKVPSVERPMIVGVARAGAR